MDMTPQTWPEWYDGRHINEVHERDVRVSGAGGRLRLVGHPGFVHQLQACAVRESEKVGAEVRPRVVVARIWHGVKIAHKEVLCSLEVVDV